MAQFNKDQMLKHYQQTSPKELIALFEGLREKLIDLVDITRDPGGMFDRAVSDVVESWVMDSYQSALESVDYGDETQLMESFGEDGLIGGEVLPLQQVHQRNLKQLLENSIADTRTASANQFNMNQLTPFDAFLPFTIIRSYLPLFGKDLMPAQTPPQPFIRIKQMYKYIVTKDNQRFLRPDIYNDAAKMQEILDSAKGPRVSDSWYPIVEEEDDTAEQVTFGGDTIKIPAGRLSIAEIDLLKESGGLINIGDALDIDVCVDGIRAVVTASDGTKTVVEQTGYKAYPDLTSITPQRSVSFTVKIPVRNKDGEIESTVTDKIFGEFDYRTNTFNLISQYGYVRQIQFDGHRSNKNNYQYLSFTHDYGVEQHPIPEGYKSNVPITNEDMALFNETASIDIIATAINEMTEIFTQAEDASIINKVNVERDRWAGKGQDEHPFQHMYGPVVFEKTVDVSADSTNKFLKRYEGVQDKINFALRAFIGDMRDTLKAEPFRVVAFCHPNLASLFVGNNVDWKITPGIAGTEGVRMDYKMGVYTSDGNSFRILTSQKIAEADGLRFLIFPINEQNFLSWKHFKYSMYFDREHRNDQMILVPNIMGYAKFYTHSYTPLQATLHIEGYK